MFSSAASARFLGDACNEKKSQIPPNIRSYFQVRPKRRRNYQILKYNPCTQCFNFVLRKESANKSLGAHQIRKSVTDHNKKMHCLSVEDIAITQQPLKVSYSLVVVLDEGTYRARTSK